jgi:hypothetical protein
MSKNETKDTKILEDKLAEAQKIFEDLVRCGSFYHRAIELDSHIEDPVDGDTFSLRINMWLNGQLP